jgi:hypothetical protein
MHAHKGPPPGQLFENTIFVLQNTAAIGGGIGDIGIQGDHISGSLIGIPGSAVWTLACGGTRTKQQKPLHWVAVPKAMRARRPNARAKATHRLEARVTVRPATRSAHAPTPRARGYIS